MRRAPAQTTPIAAASALFARQDGAGTIDQLIACGVSRGLIRQRVATGEWVRLATGIVGPASSRLGWRQRVRVAGLAGGPSCAVSGVTAGRLYGLDGLDRIDDVHLTTIGGVHRRSIVGAEVHRSTLLERRHCTDVDGMTTVLRPIALVQIAATNGADLAAQALDSMLRSGDHPIWIRGLVQHWARPGVGGARTVLGLLDQRVDGTLPASWFQRLVSRVVAARGLDMLDEYPVYDGHRLLARLDLALPDLRIGLECQSWRWHATPSARAADARRRRALRMLGWEIVEVWWADLDRMDQVVDEVLFLVDQRMAGDLDHPRSWTTGDGQRPQGGRVHRWRGVDC